MSGALSAWGQTAAPAAKTFDYVVSKGDTCISIARKELGNSKAYHKIHEHNPDLGKTPHKLSPGQVLKLPRPDHPDAEVTSTQREVKAQEGRRGAWFPAAPGLSMYRGWRVQTYQDAFADLRFVDTSTLSMSPNTLVIIYGQGSSNVGSASPTRAQLTRGSLRARLDELSGRNQKLELVTPSSKASFRGGETLVEVGATGLSRIENHGEGQARVSDPSGKYAVPIPRSMGTKVAKGKAPRPPQPLPPTPVWTGAERSSLAMPGQGAMAKGSWHAVPNAVAYRIELRRLSQDHDRAETLNVFKVDASTRAYHIKALTPGRYAVTVASIDAEDFTSIPSLAQAFEIREIGATLKGRPLPLDPHDGRIRVPYGAALLLPEQARCLSPTLALGNPEGLVTPGDHEIHCQDSGGKDMEPIAVTVLSRPPTQSSHHVLRNARQLPDLAGKANASSFDLGVGVSFLKLRLQSDPSDPPSTPASEDHLKAFLDLGLRYIAKPWLGVALAQHLSLPKKLKDGGRQRFVHLGVSATVDFIYPKWRLQPIAGIGGGVLKRLASPVPGNWLFQGHVGAQLSFRRGFALSLRTSVLRIQYFEHKRGYNSLRAALMTSYRFKTFGRG